MDKCKSVSTPLEKKIDCESLEKSIENEKYPCRNVIGSIMYAMLCTRPDLCYAISLLSRYQAKGSENLWKLLKRLLRYIKGTIDYKLIFRKTSRSKINENDIEPLLCYADASFATNDPEARSTTGYLLKTFEQNLVMWASRRQSTVALSTMIAEYNALCEATRDVIWARQLMSFLGINISKPTIIYQDNASCIAIAKNPVNHKGTRQMNTKLFFVRDELNKTIFLKPVSTNENEADILTKSLDNKRFHVICSKILLKRLTDE